jgi:hypothetical protein
MILLTGNVLALFEGIAIVALLLFIPFGLLFWYLISKTKFYKETYSNGNPTKRLAVSVGMIATTFGIFLLLAYIIFKIIVD